MLRLVNIVVRPNYALTSCLICRPICLLMRRNFVSSSVDSGSRRILELRHFPAVFIRDASQDIPDSSKSKFIHYDT
jgi:hypothetical protein